MNLGDLLFPDRRERLNDNTIQQAMRVCCVLLQRRRRTSRFSVAKACRPRDYSFPKDVFAFRSAWCGSCVVLEVTGIGPACYRTKAGFRMQGTEFDDLRAARDRPGGPTLLPQIVEQRKALFQFFDILAHRRSFASGGERRRRWSAFPGKDGGQE